MNHTTVSAATATLTRIQLNRNHPDVRRDLADANELHKTVMRLIPDGLGASPRQQAGLLFRLEAHPADQPTLLVQSRRPPLLDRLPPSYGTAHTRDLTRMLTHLTAGMAVRYRITANATKSTGHRVTPLHGHDALAWWHTRATRAGMHLLNATAERRRFQHHRRHGDTPFHALTQFDGAATITDPSFLADALLAGIGKGKAYGAGLLSLTPFTH